MHISTARKFRLLYHRHHLHLHQPMRDIAKISVTRSNYFNSFPKSKNTLPLFTYFIATSGFKLTAVQKGTMDHQVNLTP